MLENETTHEELLKQLTQCKEENEAKSEFLSMVTHQLRTPLSGNKWAFKMLLDGDLGKLTDEQKMVIQKGSDATDQMIDLLKEIIQANQNDSWSFQYEFKKTDITKILEKLVAEFEESAKAHDVTLHLHISDKAEGLAEIDTEKITFALQNILENAIKYSKAGSSVDVALVQDNNEAHVAIRDHGIGIPQEQQEKIFTKFFRADNAKELKKEGTGLGLFTAKKIIERHHGKIWFESKEGDGTTFHLEIPHTQ